MLNSRTSQLIGRITEADVENVWTDLSRQGKEWQTGLFVHMLEQVAISAELARPKFDAHGQVIDNFRVITENMVARDYSQSRDWLGSCDSTEEEIEVPEEILEPGRRRRSGSGRRSARRIMTPGCGI